MDGWNTTYFPIGISRPIFRGKLGPVSFREGIFKGEVYI